MKKPFVSALAAGAAMCVFAYFVVAEFLPAAWALLIGAGVGALSACVAYSPAEVWRAMVVAWRTTSGATGRAIVYAAEWLVLVVKELPAAAKKLWFCLLHRTAITLHHTFWILVVVAVWAYLFLLSERSFTWVDWSVLVVTDIMLTALTVFFCSILGFAQAGLLIELLSFDELDEKKWHWRRAVPKWFSRSVEDVLKLPAETQLIAPPGGACGWRTIDHVAARISCYDWLGRSDDKPYSNKKWLVVHMLLLALEVWVACWVVLNIVALPFRILAWVWRFVVVVWRQIHSRMRIMAMVDGSFGGLVALIGANQWDSNLLNQSPLAKLAVIGLGVVLAEVFGYLNYRLVALEVLKIQPTD